MVSDIFQRFGAAVRRIRKSKSITQEKLSELASLDRTYISDVELGKRNVSLRAIAAIADALGMPISELFKLED